MFSQRTIVVASFFGILTIAGSVGGCERFQSGQHQILSACTNQLKGTTEQCNCFAAGLRNSPDSVQKDIAQYLRESARIGAITDANQQEVEGEKLRSSLIQLYGPQDSAAIQEAIGRNLKACNVNDVGSDTRNFWMKALRP